MFFIFGIDQGQKQFEFNQTILCPCCGKYGRLEVFAAYTFFSLFFIPLFKWNKRYSVRSSCCNTVYAIEKELGKSIEKGECTALRYEDLRILNKGSKGRSCFACEFSSEDDSFQYCPLCGSKLN